MRTSVWPKGPKKRTEEVNKAQFLERKKQTVRSAHLPRCKPLEHDDPSLRIAAAVVEPFAERLLYNRPRGQPCTRRVPQPLGELGPRQRRREGEAGLRGLLGAGSWGERRRVGDEGRGRRETHVEDVV